MDEHIEQALRRAWLDWQEDKSHLPYFGFREWSAGDWGFEYTRAQLLIVNQEKFFWFMLKYS